MWKFWIGATIVSLLDQSGVPVAQAGATIYLASQTGDGSEFVWLWLLFCLTGYGWDVACLRGGRHVLSWFGSETLVVKAVERFSGYPHATALLGRFVPGIGRYIGLTLVGAPGRSTVLHLLLVAGNGMFAGMGILIGLVVDISLVQTLEKAGSGLAHWLGIVALVLIVAYYAAAICKRRTRRLSVPDLDIPDVVNKLKHRP